MFRVGDLKTNPQPVVLNFENQSHSSQILHILQVEVPPQPHP